MIRMRDKNLNYIQFYKQVEKFVVGKLQLPRMLRTAVINSPTFPENLTIRYPRKFSDLQSVVILHWFFPENLMWRTHLDLEDLTLSQFNEKQKLEIKILLSSKENCIKYLYRTKRYSSHEIFGNIINRGFSIVVNMKIIPKSLKVKETQRKRGYDDKGSLRPKDKWLPTYDLTLTVLQNEKEKKITRQRKSIQRITRILENVELE